jgi:protocatechuate 3,4-dioxygenase beta subunit
LTYYWLTFSSTRTSYAKTGDGTLAEQLYVAGVVVDGMGNITTYAPIYLWNQNDTVNNLTPAWGNYSFP